VLTDIARLKCDRNVPCSNCVARKTNCIFSPQARDRNRISGLRTEAREQVDARIHRLEQLVKSMISPESLPQASHANGTGEQPSMVPSDAQQPSADIESGRIMTNNHQTVYVSGAHWASICYEVSYKNRHCVCYSPSTEKLSATTGSRHP
jgi:hypothetical protein